MQNSVETKRSNAYEDHQSLLLKQSQGECSRNKLIRLQKFLADAGIASRRKCEEYILQGKVSINGNIITELGTKVNVEKDKIFFEGKLIPTSEDKMEGKMGKMVPEGTYLNSVEIPHSEGVSPDGTYQLQKKHIYILLNKPIGYVTTSKDQFDRDTVLDLIKGVNKRIVPVGRLDMYTSGALLLTNDGDFVYKLTHPKHEIDKTYTVTIRGIVTNEEVDILRRGVDIGDYVTRDAKVKILKTDLEKNVSRLEIVIHEGKNRQVRRMCESIGKRVLALHRSKIGNIGVKGLPIGQWRYLSVAEVVDLIDI